MTNIKAWALAGAALLPGVAQAQTAPPPISSASGDIATGDIVVTAQRRSERLIDVPVAVTAVTGDALEQRNLTGLGDVSKLAAGVTFAEGINAGGNQVSIRGVSTYAFTPSIEQSVSIVVDGVVFARNVEAYFDLVDVDRIEVLRGPQGTLFGKNASGGVVNIVTKRPSQTFGGEGSVTYAPRYGDFQARATITGPITDTLAWRLTGSHQEVDGNVRALTRGGVFNGRNSDAVRGKLLFTPSADLEMLLSADYQNISTTCCQYTDRIQTNPVLVAATAPAISGPRNLDSTADQDTHDDSEAAGGSAEINYKLAGGATLSSITSYRWFSADRAFDVDNTRFQSVPSPGVTTTLALGSPTNRTFTQELRVTSAPGSALEYVAGLYYFNLRSRTYTGLRFGLCAFPPAGPACLVPLTAAADLDTRVNNRNYSAFGDLTYNIDDRFSVFGGLRVIHETLRVRYVRTADAIGSTIFPPLADNLRTEDTALAGRAGIRFKPGQDTMLYASYSRGYKGQAFDEQTVLPSRTAILPETADAFELGFKGSLLDKRLFVSLAAFYSKYDNLQVQTLDQATAQPRLQSVGGAEIKGVEADFRFTPRGGFSLAGSAAYIHSEITDLPNGPCYLGQGCLTQRLDGGRLPYSPRFKGNLSARYDAALSSSLGAYVQVDGTYQSKVQFQINQNPASIQNGYGVVDLLAGLRFGGGRFELSAYVKNLFDQNYAAFLNDSGVQRNQPQGGIVQIIPREASRIVGFVARARF